MLSDCHGVQAYMRIKFVVDSSSRLPFRARTHRHTHTHSHRRHWSPSPRHRLLRRGIMRSD